MQQLANQDMMSEADMEDMIRLLDFSLSSSRPLGTLRMAGCGFPMIPLDTDGFGDGLPPMAWNDDQTALITKKQLRALGKEHLLMMLRDAEKELAREREKTGCLLLAYQAMLARGQ